MKIDRRAHHDRRDFHESRGLMADLEKTVNDIAVGLSIMLAFGLGCVAGFAVCSILAHYRLVTL